MPLRCDDGRQRRRRLHEGQVLSSSIVKSIFSLGHLEHYLVLAVTLSYCEDLVLLEVFAGKARIWTQFSRMPKRIMLA